MANRKITSLVALTAPATDDVLPIIDISETGNDLKNKKITYGELFKSLPDGSNTAPALAFNSSTTTGIYRSAVNELSIATNGGQAIKVESDNKTTIYGDLVVTGGTTTISSTQIDVNDKNLQLATGNSSDSGADGGGLTVKGASDKTWNWVDSTDAWTANQHIDVTTGKVYKIAGTEVLNATTLGAGVVNSSLTSVGTLGSLTVTNAVTAGSLDISGGADIDGTLEADAYTVNGTALNEYIADTVGAMVSSNTETNITVTYDDADNTLDFVIGTLNQDTTGNAATATALETARTIGGVSFNGTANINLPGVNQTGNQNTTGSAATLTTARTIGGVSFDGSANINLPGVNAAGNQNTSGTAAGLSGTPNITVGVVTGGSLDISGDADIDGTLEADAYTVDGTALNEYIADTVGAMVSSNTESDIVVTYQDSDNTLDFTVSNISGTSGGLSGTPNITVGVVTGGSLDISGNADIDGTLEADAITVDGTALNEFIADTVGAMVSSNTETNIAVTYDDSDNTLDFVISSYPAASISGTTLASNVVTSSLTSVGTLGTLTVTNAVTAGSLDISGGVDVDGTLEADAITVDGTALNEYIADTVGAMVSSNTESDIVVTYQDSDNTLDFTVSNISGNAGTATALQNARTIGGVSFDGTANIDLPGVNTAGNQNTSGTAANLSGTPNITVGIVTAASLDISGNADIDGTLEADAITVDGTALDEFIADTIGAMVGSNTETGITVTYDDSDNTLDFVIGTLNQDTTGTAALATEFTVTANNSTDETVYPTFVDGATGSQGAETDTALTYNPSTGLFTSTVFGGSGANLTNLNASQLSSGTIAAVRLDTATTQSASNNSTKIATTAYVDTAVSNLVDGSPGALNTLNELAAALGDDANFSTTVTNSIAAKLPLAGGTMTGALNMGNQNITNGGTITGTFVGNITGNVTGNTSGTAGGLTGTPNITVGVVTAASLDISGNVDVDGTLETDALTIDGVSLSETIADTVGAMVGSNTETGITVTYDDSDNTLDFVVGTLNQDTTGNAATATALATARTINGVSFDGTGNITVTAAAGTLTGNTLASGVTASSLTSVGTLTGLSVSGDILMTGTGAIDVPTGTTAQRPGSPTTGAFRYNSTDAQFEGYTASGWGAIAGGGGGGASDFQYLALRNSANDGAASYPASDFTLVTSGTSNAISPTAANTLLVSIGGVIQQPNTGTSTPTTGFAISGSTIKFGSNISSAPDFIIYQLGAGIGTPSDNAVTEAKLNASNSPTNGYFLQAQSGTTGGLTWAAAPANDSSTGIDFDDNVKARWGTGNDLEIFHDGSHTRLYNSTGNLSCKSSAYYFNNVLGTENCLDIVQNGAVSLYYDHSKKLETASDKVMFSAHAKVAANDTYDLGASGARWKDLYISNDIDISDNGKILLGTGDDLQIYHDGSNSIINDAGTGSLRIAHDGNNHWEFGNASLKGNDGRVIILGDSSDLRIYHSTVNRFDSYGKKNEFINKGTDGSISEYMVKMVPDGQVELYYNGSKKFQTDTDGVIVTGNLYQVDGDKIMLGNTSDLQLYHDGSNSYIMETGTGDLFITGKNNIRFLDYGTNEDMAKMSSEGSVELFYDNTKKLETTSQGVEISNGAGTAHLNLRGGSGNECRLNFIADNNEDWNDNSRIRGSQGDLYIELYNGSAWEVAAKFIHGDASELYFNGIKCIQAGPNANNARVSGFFEAFWDQGDAQYVYNGSNYGFHKLQTSVNNWIAVVENSNNSAPYGLLVKFSDASPDNNTHEAIAFADSTTGKYKVYSDGDVWNHDNSYTGSDATLKENIVDATPKLEDLKKIKVRNFNWKSEYFPEKSKKKQLGFIAQEVEEVFPALVTEHDISPEAGDKDHTPIMKKAIKQAWDPIIIKAMQELITKVETLETKVAALEGA